MSHPYSRNELRRLLAAWCNGAITSEEVDALEELLHADPAARLTYLEYASAEAELYSTHATSHAGFGADENAVPALARFNPLEPGHDAIAPYASRRNRGAARRLLSVMLIAASFAALAAVSSWVAQHSFGGKPNAGLAGNSLSAATDGGRPLSRLESSTSVAVARVTATRNCRWGAATPLVGFKSSLTAGQRVELLAGVAELTFDSGVRLVLEGPATLNLDSGHNAILEQGRLAVTLPPKSLEESSSDIPVRLPRVGFALSESGNERGLHFGLSVDERGEEEVHVFRGDIETYLASSPTPLARSVLLHPHEAARVKPASTTLAKFYADADKFVRNIATGAGPHDGLYAYEGFDYPEGPLSRQNGGFGWAGAWADIEAACPPGEIATNVVRGESLRVQDLDFRTLGGHAAQIAQQNRIRRALSTSLGGVFDSAELVENQDGHRLVGANGKTVYVSFLQRVDRVDDGFYGFELHRGDGNPNRVLCVGNGAEGAGYGVTSNYNAYGKENYVSLGSEDDRVNLIVVKIEYGQQHRDLVTVYRNPESLTDESRSTSDARLRGNFAFDRISFGDFDGEKLHEIDEVRVGTSYRAVTGRRDRGAELITPSVAARLPLMKRDPLITRLVARHQGGRLLHAGASLPVVDPVY